jgi:replication-associated recombination protein RarA
MESLSSTRGYNFTKHSEMQKSLETSEAKKRVSLVEKMRPASITAYIGQKQILDSDTVLSHLLKKGEITSMIFWGPPGCGKVKILFSLFFCFL